MATTWSFLDYTSYGTTSATTVADAYHLTGAPIDATTSVNVAFILPRANDPTALLQSDWGTRQDTLAQLGSNVWTEYGATTADYNALLAYLTTNGTPIGDASGSDGYISSPESRTIWATLTPAQFDAVFGVPLYQTGTDHHHHSNMLYWNDGITVPTGVAGLWFDFAPWSGPRPATSNLGGTTSYQPPHGPFSIGNGLSPSQNDNTQTESTNFSGDIADWFYNYPLAGQAVPTATIGLIEPLVGDAGTTVSFQQALNAFRARAGVPTPGSYYLVANNGTSDDGDMGERSLDVGVVASAAPGSTIGLYAGSGVYDDSINNYANSSTFTAWQAAFFDSVNDPAVVSSSFGQVGQPAPESPFLWAVQQLFIDAALANITVVQANNDFGSSWGFANGLANQSITLSSPYVMLVGGTSLTTLAGAPHDVTLTDTIYARAMAGDLATLWLLVEGGLKSLPSGVAAVDGSMTALIESVWNTYAMSNNTISPSLFGIGAGDGGVDTTQPTPWYQQNFGLTPTSANPGNATGRGAPDVAANAGGNMFYRTPNGPMDDGSAVDGTSAAAPMWASLVAQLDTIFQDQGLPNLGFMNDLLYTAAAIAPGSFNDITFGNNVTSYAAGGTEYSSDGEPVTLTGYGYHAGPGYDLTTGLGTPNGMLLARALVAIAHHQTSYDSSPDLLDADGAGWTSGTSQSLLFQTMSAGNTTIGVTMGAESFSFASTASGAFAWSNQFAQQSLQADFDPALVRLFDKQAHGAVRQWSVDAGDTVAVSMNAMSGQAVQATLSNPFGFADFLTAGGDVRVARAVAVAETAGGADDQIAIVRIRQNGEDNLALTFYRVDDLNGTINGLAPGDAGYQAAVAGRAYLAISGSTSIGGPGYGQFLQTGLVDVDSGDLIAMQLSNISTGIVYSAFERGNAAIDNQSHLWSYGHNTWGWEDTFGGGDRDYNDIVVGLDFVSAYGSGYLVR